MANFRRGTSHMKSTNRNVDWTPNFYWKDGEKKYLQFITELEDIPTVDYHQMMIVGFRKDKDGNEDRSKPDYKNFISPQDPGVEGSSGYDPIKDRFGYLPKRRMIAVAMEVEPVFVAGSRKPKSFEPKTSTFTKRDGTSVTAPNVALIIMPKGFYSWFVTHCEDTGDEFTEKVFVVKRDGTGPDTEYKATAVGDAIEVDTSEIPIDLDQVLEDLSSESRMHELIDPLPDSWKISNFPPTGTPTASTSGETAPPWDEATDTTEEPAPSRRGSAFDKLREKSASS